MKKAHKLDQRDPFTTEVTISHPDITKWPITCRGVIDTGATRTSIDRGLVRTLKLERAGKVSVRNANGVQRRDLVWLQLEVFDELIILKASVTNRSKLSCPILIGRDILHNAYTEEE